MKSLYSKQFLNFIRIIAIIFCVFMIKHIYTAIYDVINYKSYTHILTLIAVSVIPVFMTIIIIHPERFALFVPPLLIFAIPVLLSSHSSRYPILEIEISIMILLLRGFFNKHKLIKIISICVICLALFLSKIRFGWANFILQIFDTAQILMLTTILFFLFFEYLKPHYTKDQVLNIADFPETTSRDAKWLCLVQQGIKYEAIAIDYELNVGTVQNRLNKVYHIIETGDRIGFLSMYSNAKIIFQPSR